MGGQQQEYQKVVDAEWAILYEKLEKLYLSGAKVVLSKLPIGDVATQYFADRDMFCAGRVPDEDLRRTMKACGGSILTTVADLGDSVLGSCQHFEERQIGGERSESNEIWAIVFFAFQRYSSKFVSDYASVDEESDFSYKKSLFIKKNTSQ